MNRNATYAAGLILSLGLIAIPAAAQSPAPSSSQSTTSGQSLGDYARQVRKAPEASSKPKVFDNDNLPRTDKLSIVGNAPAPPASQANPGEPTKNAEAAPAAETKEGTEPKAAESATKAPAKAPSDEATRQAAVKQWTEKVDAQKAQIDLLSRELDVLQREYQLRAAAMYADAGNRLRNQADWDKQDTQYKQQIADKQKTIEDAKQKLEEMQDEARKAGMPESVQQQ